MVVHLTSPTGKYDTLYLRNYLRLHVKDQLASIPGVGDAQPFGGGDYAMRLWLDPVKIAPRGPTAGDAVRAVREQNVQVSAGQPGAAPMTNRSDFLTLTHDKGLRPPPQEFGGTCTQRSPDGGTRRLAHDH